jgi:hypothetical protein
MSCRPPCARHSLAGAVVAPQCCCEPAGAVVTRPCCHEPAGAVITHLCCHEPAGAAVTCHPGLRRVVCAFIIGRCWPPLVLVALCCLSLCSLCCVVHPCACRVVLFSPRSLCCPGICYVIPVFSCRVVPSGGRLDLLALVTLSDMAPAPRSLHSLGNSIWIPYGLGGFHPPVHAFHMDYFLAGSPAIFSVHTHYGFHMECSWNGAFHGLVHG